MMQVILMSPSTSAVDGVHTMASGEEVPEMAVRILEAAMALFAKKGYAATSVREIVQAAKVTNPMLYYYFESKEGLFHKLINLLFEDIEARIKNALEASQHEGMRAQLREVIRLHVETAQKSPVALQFVYAVLFGPRDSYPDFDPRAKRTPLTTTLLEIFEKAEKDGIFTPHEGFTLEFLTTQFLGMLNQHLLLVLVKRTQADCGSQDDADPFTLPCQGEVMIDHLMNFFLKGAGTFREGATS